ncbi:multiple sugar transport system substrate-binding protein [Breznakia sp. PH1-1]|nr:multiple sugar transport system substrate-binding protein [Breznakia sp. PH1-1]MDH6404752.1 multiple sugar transport system substrate-binding protein [Breznakia sp. PF1-11]MDH6412467.1 multiple sugar transport system substrate-binding protein [Breznakia sp. PFB1-11]MDH6414827.1 multiple sugar transport system substrate-binding protein [Breznakia sp. PFB1-14]MDH6417129.1 multiple sugar transport system substrate-binding protein [Breznakia sp. PFB1-4]MDH6419500.1 multiple sugar transport syst
MMKNRKLKLLLVFALLVGGVVFTVYTYNQPIVVRLGIFAGSNWDVPSGKTYEVIDEAIAAFEKENPNVQIEYDSGILKEDYSLWLSNQIVQGNEPDVFVVLNEDFNTFSSLGVLKNLNSLVEEDQSFDTNKYYKSALDFGVYQEKQYALPFESNPTLMFVNKTLLEKEGIDIPSNEWTLDELYTIAKQVTKDVDGDGKVDQYGCYDYDWLDSMFAHSVELFDEDGQECYVGEDRVKESIIYAKKLMDLHQGETLTAEDFDKGKVAFSPMQLSQYRTYKPYPWRVKKYSNFEWDCLKMPSVDANSGNSETSTMLLGMSSRTSHEDVAWKFLKKLSYDENTQLHLIKNSQGISPLRSVTESSETIEAIQIENEEGMVNLSMLTDVMEDTASHSQFKKYESSRALIDTRLQQIMMNSEDIDIALIRLQKEINKYLKE